VEEHEYSRDDEDEEKVYYEQEWIGRELEDAEDWDVVPNVQVR